MADEGVGKIFFPRKKKKPPDERTVTVETADEKATSDSAHGPAVANKKAMHQRSRRACTTCL